MRDGSEGETVLTPAQGFGAWIVSAPKTLRGKPWGTRISVQFVLELMASGASTEDIHATYPHVSAEGIAAPLRYATKS